MRCFIRIISLAVFILPGLALSLAQDASRPSAPERELNRRALTTSVYVMTTGRTSVVMQWRRACEEPTGPALFSQTTPSDIRIRDGFGYPGRTPQSRQIISPPVRATQSTSSEAGGANRSAADRDLYKLVFLAGYERKLNYRMDKLKDDELYEHDREAAFNSLIEELNKFGSQNYKVEFVYDGEAPFAILKAADKPYEYAWFEIGSYQIHRNIVGSRGKYSTLADKGFHLFQHDYFDVACGTESGECTTFENFFLEREKGEERPVRYRLISKGPVQFWHENKLTGDILKQIQDGLSAGFYPVQMLNDYEALLESPAQGNTSAINWQDLQLARDTSNSTTGKDNLSKNVNKLAAQGYRLMLIGTGLALMNRPTNPATPVSYVWVNASNKDFAQRVAELQGEGAIFRAVYQHINEFGILPQLIFELPTVSDGKKREYKLLKFDLYSAETATAISGRVQSHIDLSPDSKDTQQKLDDLARAGFIVRGLFISDGFNILLERVK